MRLVESVKTKHFHFGAIDACGCQVKICVIPNARLGRFRSDALLPVLTSPHCNSWRNNWLVESITNGSHGHTWYGFQQYKNSNKIYNVGLAYRLSRDALTWVHLFRGIPRHEKCHKSWIEARQIVAVKKSGKYSARKRGDIGILDWFVCCHHRSDRFLVRCLKSYRPLYMPTPTAAHWKKTITLNVISSSLSLFGLDR